MMSFEEIIDFYYRTNTVDFDVYEKHQDCISVFSKNLTDVYYNHVIPVANTRAQQLLKSTISEFEKYKRNNAVCILPISVEYDQKIQNLKNVANDIWMKFDNSFFQRIEYPKEFSFKIIGREYINEYIDIFMRGFSSGVYGQLPQEYATVERLCFDSLNRHVIAMAFYKENPIGVVRAIIEDDKAFVFAFAIPKENRFAGLTAKLLGSFILGEILNRGGKHIFLQTEAGTVLERFYLKSGFNKLFLGRYYTEEQ